MKRLMTIISIILLTGCTVNSNHSAYTINDEYELIKTSGNAFELFPKQDAVYATQYVPAKIVEIAWDDLYIIAKQIEDKSNPNNPESSITNKQNEQYWIIDMNNNRRFGPYNEKQFQEQKEAFRISQQLQNIEVYLSKQSKQSTNT
ncbi:MULTISPECIES: DUF3997 domain-containing protein [Bacillus cereus group]|uniref:DUF3997 domain-containing protein n=1 Tax=Bacillus cereus TaxID=1396 RepID=A0AA44TGX0_BACCE|nr:MULTISPECIES: DUF3997 domain-containing protein [Bacillus cereus group]PFA24115.1 DUF3997 domain-containing protein [Bacillus cereus]PFN09553.1 DUF3997 domain-containing protein [Bacillus cereus]PFO81461.1 DUF3997 domain-containing protein [Bacillus cereus]PFR23167.1 DUF3997 domain-containing protein [Bacillus cereus]PFS03863.1 DUF3997 domain-containing protein [Bacillus cereus]